MPRHELERLAKILSRLGSNHDGEVLAAGDGQALRDEAGKIKYAPCVWFADRAGSDRFSDSVLAALDRFQGVAARPAGGELW
jgi:hypothetical protein